VNKEPESTEFVEERNLLKRYLSDEIAPMIFADMASELFEVPAQVVAKEIRSWVSDQFSGSSNLSASDLIFHSAKKIQLIGELELIPRDELKEYLNNLLPLLLQVCPEAEREHLKQGLQHLEVSNSGKGAKVGVVHRPTGGGSPGGVGGGGAGGGGGVGGVPGGGGALGGVGNVPGGVPGQVPPPVGLGAEHSGLLRLNMLLDRLESHPAIPPAPGGGSSDAEIPKNDALLAQVVDEVATQANSAKEFDTQMGFLQNLGVASLDTGVFRILSQSMPDWAPPPHTVVEDVEPPTGAIRAMRKVVQLAKDSGEILRRFSELVTVAIEEFNEGSLGRAVTMIDLAERMIADEEVDVSTVKTVIDQTYPDLDHEQLRKLVEIEDKHTLLRRLMNFFPQLRVDELLSELQVEERRDQRRFLLKLLTVLGDEARVAVIHGLKESITGANPQPWYVDRNLVYLLRTIPRKPGAEIDHEIDLLVQASDLGGPLPVVREGLTSLGLIENERAESTIVARVSELEDALMGVKELPHEENELRGLLGNAIKILVRSPSPEARTCVVNHGLKRHAQLGDTLGRVALLAGSDLSSTPELLGRLTEALAQELPMKVFGVSVKTQRKAQNIENLISAISGSDTPEVRQILSDIVNQFPGQRFAEASARALSEIDQAAKTAKDDSAVIATLTGDLDIFGLPNLLQNLADTGVTGNLSVLDPSGNTTATIILEQGNMISAKAGKLSDETAVYQLLERPAHGRFLFINKEGAPEGQPVAENAHSVMSLLLEGMRRYDEFTRAANLVPDDAQFKPGKKKPSDVKEDPDPKLAKAVWGEAAHGVAPSVCEATVAFDSYRVRRLYEHWVTEGSLVPKE
jgi:hypothetical protein